MTIIDQLNAEGIQLSELAQSVVLGAGVRTKEDMHSLLSSFPSIALKFGIPSARITAAFMPNLAAAYLPVMAPSALPPSPAMGAIAPTGTAMNIGSVAGIASRPSTTISGAAPGVPPAPIDLRLPGWPVRDQGQRGTCVAFGSTACVEHRLSGTEPPNPDFSEQFLYYEIKTASADPKKASDGTWLQFARDMLNSAGICHENLAPYVGPGPITPVSGAAPSPAAIADAGRFKLSASTYQNKPASAANMVLSLLQNGRPVAVSLPVFSDSANSTTNNWSTQVAWLYGRIFDPPFQSVATGGHCVCVTGFVPDTAEPHGGYFIFRNSWGRAWSSASPSPANSSAPEPGYGEISATYIDNYCWELIQM